MSRLRRLAGILGAVWLTACSESGPLHMSAGPSEERPEVFQTEVASFADLDGDWTWTSEEHLTFPDWVAVAIFGIQPEGPTMSARCENEGTMSLDPSGPGFTGELLFTAHECVTRSGQTFQDPGAFVPREIVDGILSGRSLRMLVDSPLVDCELHAVIGDAVGGLAVALDGGGRCIVPGHPQSELSVPPPPAGTSKILHWNAVRS